MPDLATGNITMRITDEGYNVSFWVKTDQYTYNHQQQWSWSDSGVMTFDMNNRGTWQLVGRVGIPNSRNVGWTIYNASLGFPTTTQTMYVNRATVPPAPYWTDVHITSSSSIYAQFGSSGDGGAAVDTWQIGYGTDPNYPQYYVNTYAQNFTGLDNNYIWYFWGRGHNSQGWGPWSARFAARPWHIPDAPTQVTVSQLTQKSLHTSFRGNWDGGTAVDNYQLAYGKDPNTPEVFLDNQNSGESDLNNLDPGKTYYFWARAHNQVGWSPYSTVRVATLIAGARVKVGAEWKRAVPYVKVGGVWKLARPWVKVGGVWKEQQQ